MSKAVKGRGRTILSFVAGLVLLVVSIGAAIDEQGGYHPALAFMSAAGALLIVTSLLLGTGRRRRWATADLTVAGPPQQTIRQGWIVTETVYDGLSDTDKARVATGRTSGFAALYRGKDNRTSTSKSVALAWTYAVVFGLLSLLALEFMGNGTAWNALTDGGELKEEYLLLLGGPYAAAVIAKYAAVASSGGDNKTGNPDHDPKLGGDAKALVSDDVGDTDLGDLQYVLFNLVALAFFLGSLISHPKSGFPDLPNLLVGLALTSAATYTAKQTVISAAGPQMGTVFPTTVQVGSVVEIFGRNLVVDGEPPGVSLDGTDVGQVSVLESVGSGDHLQFTVPAGVQPGDRLVRVVTSQGATAKARAGTEFLELKVV